MPPARAWSQGRSQSQRLGDQIQLRRVCSMYIRHKNKDCLFIKYRRCILAGKKAPAGAHLDAPSLDNTDSVYVTHRNTDSVHVINRNLCLRHRQCVCVFPT